jgi:hypothetical protein
LTLEGKSYLWVNCTGLVPPMLTWNHIGEVIECIGWLLLATREHAVEYLAQA